MKVGTQQDDVNDDGCMKLGLSAEHFLQELWSLTIIPFPSCQRNTFDTCSEHFPVSWFLHELWPLTLSYILHFSLLSAITNWYVRSYIPASCRYVTNLFMLVPSMHRCNLCTASKILIIQQCNFTQTWIIHLPRSARSNNNQIDQLFAPRPFKTEPLC
jgi:hypothetical protein